MSSSERSIIELGGEMVSELYKGKKVEIHCESKLYC